MPAVLGKGRTTGGNEILGRGVHVVTRATLDEGLLGPPLWGTTSRLEILGKNSLP